MKWTILILIYIAAFMGMFFILSLIGMLWMPYSEVINNINWFMMYSLLIGWWIAAFPAFEYYCLNEDYFDNL